MRIKPYPPSFRSTAARIIEPATGASTCAFGNHKCTENKGNFTRNAVKNIVTPKNEYIILGKLIQGYHIDR